MRERRSKKGPAVRPELPVISLHDRGPRSGAEAFGSVLELFPSPRFTISYDGFLADALALQSDWRAVGEDLWAAARAARAQT
jgi:hypothetical protein